MCTAVGAVRKDRSGYLYFICPCGTHPAFGEAGREWLLENANIWGEQGEPPEDAPDWIRRGLSHCPGTRSTRSYPRKAAETAAPAVSAVKPENRPPEPAPKPRSDPEQGSGSGIFGFS
jgi:hypothetical protein